MGVPDTLTKAYVAQDEIFADAFNYLIYDGKPVIQPDQLHELDTAGIALPYGTETATVPVQKYRDVLKELSVSLVGMADKDAAYLILGIENQTAIHYAMPVRNMLYDALQYTGQVAKAKKSYKQDEQKPDEQKQEKLTKEEFLSGFKKGDKLIPVITLVIYFGANEWDAPVSIHEMLTDVKPELLPFISDYKVNLIAPASMDDDSFHKFKSGLGAVLMCIKHSQDNDFSVMKSDMFQRLDRRTADLINVVSGMKVNLDEYTDKEGNTNMCKAYENSQTMAKNEGIAIGEEKGANLMAKLAMLLVKDGRTDDIVRAGSDEKYRNLLFKEYRLA